MLAKALLAKLHTNSVSRNSKNWKVLKNSTFCIKTVESTLPVVRHLVCNDVSAVKLSGEGVNCIVDNPSANSSDFLVFFGKARDNVELALPPLPLFPTPKVGCRHLPSEFKSSYFIRLF